MAVAMAMPADGPSFGRRAFRHVNVDVATCSNVGGAMPKATARERT